MTEYTAVDFHSDRVEDFARQYDDSAAFRERFAVWAALIARYGAADRDAIDVGCGVGTFTLEAAKHARAALGVDASDKMIAAAQRHAGPNVTFRHATIAELGQAAQLPVGLVLCSSVLEYVDDLSGSLDVLASLVAPGGHLIISMPNPASLYRRAERVAFRLTRKPAYYQFVQHVVPLERLATDLETRGLSQVEALTYGRVARRRVGTLFVAVFVRA